jgi:hypothetical protein
VVADFSILARESNTLVAATLTMVERELERQEIAVVPFDAPWLRLNYGFISRPSYMPSTIRRISLESPTSGSSSPIGGDYRLHGTRNESRSQIAFRTAGARSVGSPSTRIAKLISGPGICRKGM